MLEERKQQIFNQVRHNFMRDVTKKEVEELEQEYGIKADSYSCYNCVYNFVCQCLKIEDKRKALAQAEPAPAPAKAGGKRKRKTNAIG